MNEAEWDKYAAACAPMWGVTTDENGEMWKNGHPSYPEAGGEIHGSAMAAMLELRFGLPKDMYKRASDCQMANEASKAADEATEQMALPREYEFHPFQGRSVGPARRRDSWSFPIGYGDLANMAATEDLRLYALLQAVKLAIEELDEKGVNVGPAGNIEAFVNQEGCLCMNFTTAFKVGDPLLPLLQETLNKVKGLEPHAAKLFTEMAQKIDRDIDKKMDDMTGCCGFGSHDPNQQAKAMKAMANLARGASQPGDLG